MYLTQEDIDLVNLNPSRVRIVKDHRVRFGPGGDLTGSVGVQFGLFLFHPGIITHLDDLVKITKLDQCKELDYPTLYPEGAVPLIHVPAKSDYIWSVQCTYTILK